MIGYLKAQAIIENSQVEFFQQKNSVQIKAKKITKDEKIVKAYAVQATANIVQQPSIHLKSEQLIFNTDSFEGDAQGSIDLIWGDLKAQTESLILKVKERLLQGNVPIKATYKTWNFTLPMFRYCHDGKILSFEQGGEITNGYYFLKARAGTAYLSNRFELSSGVRLVYGEYQIESSKINCELSDDHMIKKAIAPTKTTVKSQDGKVLLEGKYALYQNDKVQMKNVTGVINSVTF